jgi:hypothetical protein
MEKLGRSLAVGALGAVAWGLGLSPAAATDPAPPQVVNLQCGVFLTGTAAGPQAVWNVDASPSLSGSLARVCKAAALSCAACEAALLTAGYQLTWVVYSLQASSAYSGAYYVFIGK